MYVYFYNEGIHKSCVHVEFLGAPTYRTGHLRMVI